MPNLMTKMDGYSYIPVHLDPAVIEAVKGYGYWTEMEIKRKYKHHPAICIDVFKLPTTLFDMIPKIVNIKNYRLNVSNANSICKITGI